MKIKTTESQMFVNSTLTRALNRDKIFAPLVAYAVAMKLPLIMDGSDDSSGLKNYNMLDENVILYVMDDLNQVLPFDTTAALTYVKGFFQWRHAIAIGTIGYDVVNSADIFTRLGTYVPPHVQSTLSEYPDTTLVQRTLDGIIKVLGEINETFS